MPCKKELIPIRIRFTFGFFALWAAVLTANEYLGGKYPALPVFLLCLAHESGHIIAACAAGLPPESITFYVGGIRMSLENGTGSKGLAREILILSAGCAVNLFLAPVLYLWGMRLTAMMSLGLGLFNLLPFSSLDGGRLIKAVCEYISPASDIASAQQLCDKLLLAAAFIYLLFRGFTPLLPALVTVLLMNRKRS